MSSTSESSCAEAWCTTSPGTRKLSPAFASKSPPGYSKVRWPRMIYTICSCGWLCLAPTQPFFILCRTSIMSGLQDMTCRRSPGSGWDIDSSCEAITSIADMHSPELSCTLSARHPTAVHYQHFTRNVVACRRCQKHGRTGNIFRLPPSCGGDARQYLVIAD